MSSICDRFQFLKPSELLREDASDENEGACIGSTAVIRKKYD